MWYEEEEFEGMEEGINPFCSILYQFAGKCNKSLNPSTVYSNQVTYNANGGEISDEWLLMYQSENQFLNEDTVCAYIDSLKYNTYDEYGEVIMNPSRNMWKPSAWNNEIRIESMAMNAGMKAALILSFLAAAAMGVAACMLHGMLARKNIPFFGTPKKTEDVTSLARQNSGIVVGRSRSGPGTAPLI
jgi:hypothetical protein